jgi:hypothetical protein
LRPERKSGRSLSTDGAAAYPHPSTPVTHAGGKGRGGGVGVAMGSCTSVPEAPKKPKDKSTGAAAAALLRRQTTTTTCMSRRGRRACPPPPPPPADQRPEPFPFSGPTSSRAAASASAAWAAYAAAAAAAEEEAALPFSEVALWRLELGKVLGKDGTINALPEPQRKCFTLAAAGTRIFLYELPRHPTVHHVVNPVLQTAY